MTSSLVLKTPQASFSPSLVSSNGFQEDCFSSLLLRRVLLLLRTPASVTDHSLWFSSPDSLMTLQRVSMAPYSICTSEMQHPSLRGLQPYGTLFSNVLWEKLGRFKPSATGYFPIPILTQGTISKAERSLRPQDAAVLKVHMQIN